MALKGSHFFIAGLAVGLGAAYLIHSQKGKKVCSKVISMGLKLKEDAAIMVESAKEELEDMVAQAHHDGKQKKA